MQFKMSQDVKSTATGTVVGILNMVFTRDFLLSISVAFATGAAAFLGQYAAKWCIAWLKEHIKIKK